MVSCWLRPIGFGPCLVGCCLWGGVLCENCIVDANAIIMAMAIMIIVVVVCFSFLWFLFLVFFVVCA